MSRDLDQVLSLAAAFDALDLVQQLANEGRSDPDRAETLLAALFDFDPVSVESLYAPQRIRSGLRLLAQSLKDGPPRALAQMLMATLKLERQLIGQRERAGALRQRLVDAARSREAFGLLHENAQAALADVYAQSVSVLTPRVMVQGAPHHLQQARVVAQIRSLLLAAIRALALWRQVGGGGWRMFWRRRHWRDLARQLGAENAP